MAGPPGRKLLLVGWDGADWGVISPLMDRGEMPHLEKLVNAGVTGKLASFQPIYSPLLWNSIATGKLPDKHGIIGFTEVDEATGQVRASTSLSRKCKAVWNILSQSGLRTHAINWFSGHPAEPINGVCISELFSRQVMHPTAEAPELPEGAVHPQALREKIKDLYVLPQDIDPQTIYLFVPRFAEVDQHNDHRLEVIAGMLAECLSVHAATTWVMENEPWDFMAVSYGAIDHFCHGFMRYHPPRREWVNEQEFALYSDVVNSAYRLHDLLLGRLVQLAGPETTIILCSDHGWHSGSLRPRRLPSITAGPAEEHRPVGVFAMKGPGIAKDELVHGASVLDITPTILSLFGLPVGSDMDGRVLMEAFTDEAPRVRTIPTWEEVPGPAGMHPPGQRVRAEESRVLMERLAALGYVDPPAAKNEGMAAEITRQENKWCLARVYFFSRRFSKALPLLEDLYASNPLRLDYGLMLAECQFVLGLMAEGCQAIRNLAAAFPGDARARILLGVEEYYCGRSKAALEHLTAVEKAGAMRPYLLVYVGMAYFHLRRYRDALQTYERALSMDPDMPLAHLGVARCLFRSRTYEKAAEAALQAVGLQFSLADAHFCLARALSRLRQTKQAIQAFETGLRFQPGRADIHNTLATLYAQEPDGPEKAAEHARLGADCARRRSEGRERLKRLRQEAALRAQEREARYEEESRRLMAGAAEAALAPDASGQTGKGAAERGAPGSSGKELLIVSGLPRSGTSVMMQMLAAGDVPLLTDSRREVNEDSPEGHFGWEPLKKLRRNPRLIEQAEGKAVKVFSVLLSALPRIHSYRIIFMRRPAEEIAASQAKVLERRGRPAPRLGQSRMAQRLGRHQEAVISRLQKSPNVKVLVVDYPALVADPAEAVKRIREFLGPEMLPAPTAMALAVKPDLYRQRAGALGATTP